MQIQLSDHFTYKKLMRFVLPTVVMMIFTSIYSVVDGFFVSNFVGKTPFAAVNLIFPVLMIMGALGFMLGTGGSALVARLLGQQQPDKARQTFSLLTYVGVVLGILLAVLGIVWMRPIAVFLGAEGELVELCCIYARILLLALPGFMLQNMFQSFLITAERPRLGLAVTVIAGVANMVLDALFIAVLNMGIAGAAAATAISQMLGGVIPLVYFLLPNSSTLRLVRCRFDGKALLKALTNGASEFVTNISMSVVAVLYNFQLMHYAGEDGIAAYGVIMYVSFVFVAIFLGYAIGVSPLVGYHYGAENHSEMHNLFKKSMAFLTVSGLMLTLTAVALAGPLSRIFVGYDANLYALTTHAFRLYAVSFFFCGFGIFGSALFTALNNGAVSAAISFLRTLVFQSLSVLLLPMFWGIEGVWYAIIVAETASAALSLAFLLKGRQIYHY